MTRRELAKCIDQIIYKPDATEFEIKSFCDSAKKEGFYSVSVLPIHVSTVSKNLKGSVVKAGALISFPLGMDIPEVKILETKNAIKDGAEVINVVLNIGAIKAGDFKTVSAELKGILQIAKDKNVQVFAIIEMPLFNTDQAIKAITFIDKEGVTGITTSTAFKGLKLRDTTVEDILLIKKIIKSPIVIKASSINLNLDQILNLLENGAKYVMVGNGKELIEGIL